MDFLIKHDTKSPEFFLMSTVQDVDRFVAQHNLEHSVENPIDLRVVRAQAGAANLIWIMRKAKLAKKKRCF